ncbi:MAG: LamG domain-containing protein [Verrucomicrobia bacterium]|nr:LamG domain-containing protein [Verrucomicrobiota bacterium]
MNTSIQYLKPNVTVQPSRNSSQSKATLFVWRKPSELYVWVALLAALLLLIFGAPSARAHESPIGCTGSGLGILLFTDTADVHIGDTLNYSVTVFNGTGTGPVVCDATAIQAFVVTPDGVSHPITLVRTALSSGQSDFYPNVVSYVVRAQDIQSDDTVRATASDTGIIHQNATDSQGGGNQGVNTEVSRPCIQIGVQCVGSVGENGAITFTGTVTNCGNNTLVGVTVTNFVNGGQFPVTFITNLARGQVASFSGSWVPLNPCSPSTATLVAQGIDQFTTHPRTVTSSATTTCSEVLTPGIKVTKVCPPQPVSPGQLLTFSGSVSNTGNVTLTSIVVVDDQPAPNTPVFTLASLAPGAVANFNGSYLAPTNCSTTSALTASATSTCGVPVTSTASATCPILTTPQISVTTVCSTNIVAPGGVQSYAGTVRNTGDITLKNVVVVSDRPVANTTVFTVATLAPGASANFTGTYTVPLLNACAVTTTVIATGHDLCTAVAVTATAVVTCGVTTAPQIAITLNCPAVAVATGALITYTGVVSNPGNVTLNNVVVVDSQSSPSTVLTVPTLAPGASANFTASFTAPINACSVSSTVAASGSDACTSVVVSRSASAICTLLTTPRIAITQICPVTAVGPGGVLTFSGTVRNTGDITVTNVVVVNNRSGTTPIFTAASLAPGASATFTGSLTVGANVCAVTSTSTAQATSLCGVAVTDSVTSTCPILTAPQIFVTVTCPTNTVAPGGSLTFGGTVSNGGNITLSNVVVVSDRPATNTVVFSVATLAPGASASFTGTYTVPLTFPLNACSVIVNVTATGRDICSANIVTNIASGTCPITTTPGIAITLACPALAVAPGGLITYTGTVSNPGNITLNNVTVIDLQASPSTVLTLPSLAPGASVNFTASFTAPADACSVTSAVTASGSDACTAAVVTDSKSTTCPLVTTPLLALTQNCPVNLVGPGGIVTYTGSVKNAGNITLSNVVVFGSQSALNTGPGAPSTAGLVGYWALDEANGGGAGDSSGFGNNGSIINASRVAGQSGNALSFNGVNTSVSIPNTASLDITGPITMSAWVNPQSMAGKQNILAHGYTKAPDQNASVYLRINDGQYEVGTWNNAVQPTASAAIPSSDLGIFVHLAGVYDGSAWTIYRNGVALNTVAGIGAVPVNAQWTIGARDGGADRFFNGIIDEVRLYNRALSAAEILALAGQATTTDSSTPVFTIATLAPGTIANFTVSYLVPANGNCTFTSSLTANGNDTCTGSRVAATTTSTCTLVTAPGIQVTQVCSTTAVLPGGTLNYTGTVINTGNVTLNNIVVINDRSGSTPIFTAASLAPGATATFTGSYVTHTDCCVDSSTVTASGRDVCTGVAVADTATRTCPLLTLPKIVVTKVCPPKFDQPGTLNWNLPGELLHYSGTVSNAGNIALINVTVENDRSGTGLPILGPITLAAGEFVDYYATYILAEDFCGTDTVTARGLDSCTAAPVVSSVTTTCPIMTTPRIAVIQNCPAQPTPPGGTHTYTGTVINSGDGTLNNVFVVIDQPAHNTPVIGPISLAPGERKDFTGSYIVALNCCTTMDTVSVRGQDRCSGSNVVATATVICPLLTTPRITVTRVCPTTPVSVGGLYVFTGLVSNTGDVVLTNVFVFSNQPNPNTALLGPIELAPGESEEFTGSYTVVAGTDPAADTVTARGMDTCQARTISATANCSGPIQLNTPMITSVTLANGMATVSWTATPGTTYCLQSKGGARDAWINLPGNVTASGATASKNDSMGSIQQRFYRIMVVQE